MAESCRRFAMAGLLIAILQADFAVAQSPAPDPIAIAPTIVRENLGVRAGEKVLITGPDRELPLLEELAFQVQLLGAFPLMVIDNARMTERAVAELPLEFVGQANALKLALVDAIDAWLVVANDFPPAAGATLPPERLAAWGAAFQPIDQRLRDRSVRYLEIGNQLYPVEWRAEQAGMSLDDLKETFWSGVAVDYAELESTGEAVRNRLASGREAHVTHPDGTDLRFQIAGRPTFVSDGVISDSERRQGGAAVWTWLPAGEAYVTAVPGSAQGVLVIPRTSFFNDPSKQNQIQNFRVEFKAGRVVSISGDGPGFPPYKALFEAAGEGSGAFGVLDIGLNPRIQLPEASRLSSFIPVGSVTIAFGNDLWAGGENDVGWGDFYSLRGATVTIDGEPLVEEGRLTP